MSVRLSVCLSASLSVRLSIHLSDRLCQSVCPCCFRFLTFHLHGSNGSLSGGGDSLLHAAHVGGQSGLVTDGGRNTSEQGGHFGTGLRETEDVVDEEQHVLSFVVAEVLGDGQAGQADAGTGAWGLVHLSVHQRDLAENIG